MSSAERTVVLQPIRVRAHGLARGRRPDPRLERREELHCLRAGEQLDRERTLGVAEHDECLQPGGVAHRHMILLSCARRDRVDARRMAERLVLGDERRGHVLRDHEAGVQPAFGRQERRQPVGEARVYESLDAPLRDAGQLCNGHRECVQREGEGLAVEVAVRDDLLLGDEHERVVGRRVELDRHRRLDVVQQVARCSVDLRCAPERVRVLHLVAPTVRLDDRGAVEELPDVRRGVALAAERACGVDRLEEARSRALQRLEGQRARDVRRRREPARPNESERAHRSHELRAVDQRQPFLRGELDRLEPDRGAAPPAPGSGFPSTHADPSPTSGSARCASGARSPLAPTEPRDGTTRQHASVEAGYEQLDELRTGAREALRQRVRAQQHRRADDLRPDTGRRRRTRGCAAGGAAAPRRARRGSTARRSGRTRC